MLGFIPLQSLRKNGNNGYHEAKEKRQFFSILSVTWVSG